MGCAHHYILRFHLSLTAQNPAGPLECDVEIPVGVEGSAEECFWGGTAQACGITFEGTVFLNGGPPPAECYFSIGLNGPYCGGDKNGGGESPVGSYTVNCIDPAATITDAQVVPG